MTEQGHQARLTVIAIFFSCIFLVLVWRMYDLTITDRPFLLGQGQARSLREIDIPANRGMIIDREGSPLAVSTPVESIWVNPKVFAASEKQQIALAHLLKVPLKKLQIFIAHSKNKEFLYLVRQVDPNLARAVRDLAIPGINFQQEYKRYYPEGDSIAQLIGFTNIDDQGIEGLELAYNQWLEGVPGKKRVLKDRLGRVIDELNILSEPKPGHILQLSIDHRIQYLAFHELKKSIEEFQAKSGTVIVLDAKTGEVYAVANAPSFNPNMRFRYRRDTYRNKAFTDLFEPGSVIKTLSISSALESGLFTPSTIIDTRPGWMQVQGRLVRDIHSYGVLDVTGVLEKSSNVGVTKMVLSSPPEQLVNLYTKCGFGQRTDSGYPGESAGTLVRLKEASPFVLATLAFGYGLSVTPIQLARSFMIFANNGQLLPITLLNNPKQPNPLQVLSPKVANELLDMMESVVAKGTGRQASVSGYRVAGKTGTSRVAGVRGYEKSRHISSFVGLAPVSNPRVIVAVVINEPSRLGYYGGAVAAPLFSKVMGAALRILNVPPDKLEKTS